MSFPTIEELLTQLSAQEASDLHLVSGSPPTIRIHGILHKMGTDILKPPDTEALIRPILNDDQFKVLQQRRELDFALAIKGFSRFRVNACYQRDSLSATFRAIPSRPPRLEEMGFPKIVADITLKPRGLVLVTGPTGSGKTTTLASMIDYINRNRAVRIVTIEDPIEYLHHNDQAVISQREVGRDTLAISTALRSTLRQDPDVILVGEMRDLETIQLAISAAETGHLVFATLHVTSAAECVNRIIDVFPTDQQEQVRVQLSATIEAVFTQCLITRADGPGRACAMEVLLGTPAVRNMIRENKPSQMATAIQTGTALGMQSLEKNLAQLIAAGTVTYDAAVEHTSHPGELQRIVGEAGSGKPKFATA